MVSLMRNSSDSMNASVRRLRIGVLFGGRSGEHEVSLMSARSVLKALDPEKYAVTQIGITRQGVWLVGDDVLGVMTSEKAQGNSEHLKTATILPDPEHNVLYAFRSEKEMLLEHLTHLDVVFPVLHGTYGEDGTLQGLLEMADLAYVGAGVLGSAVAMDKGLFKDVMRANGIPVVDGFVVLRSEIKSDINSVIVKSEDLSPYPLFVKPANLGSSVGVSKCNNRSDLVEGLLEAASYDRRVIVEKGLDAREIEVSVLGNDDPQASIPGEILPSRDFYSYEAKYLNGTSDLLIPAPLPGKTKAKVQQLAILAYKAIDCAGMARVDFLLDKNAHIDEQVSGLYLNEINTIPGFTKISMYPKLWEASGVSYSELVDRLIELALERKAERDMTVRDYKRND